MRDEPIIRSLLDLDFYKLTMVQLVWKWFRNIPARYAFKNRTKSVGLADFIDENELREELESVLALRFKDDELDYLRESPHIPRGLFCEEFIAFLGGLKLCPFVLRREGAGFDIQVIGNWSEATLWETLILSVVNELYYRSVLQRQGTLEFAAWQEGTARLGKKIDILRAYPDIKFSEFGTRRRFSRKWQKQVTRKLKEAIPSQIVGTSNVLLAKELVLPPIGTFAHEMYMIFSGIFHDDIRGSHNKVLQYWWDMYGEPLSVALTDTYGSDFFFQDFTPHQARLWRGLRQDSGDPIEFGEKAIRFYQGLGIDPNSKLMVPSDGLDINTILRIANHFRGRIKLAYGWGTDLTNDLGFPPLSLVVKAVEANGYGTVKLSDNLAKAMGSQEDIESFKAIFGHTVTASEECKY